MDIGNLASEAIRYPSSNWKKVIILGLLMIASIFIIPIFLVMGYQLRIVKATFAGIDELPDFDEIGSMFVDGLKVFVVSVAYMIIPVIVILLGVFGSIWALASEGTITDPFAFMSIIGVTAVIGIILAILFGIFEIIAIANMALYDSELGAAFRFSELLERISAIGWVNYFIWLIVIFVIGVVGGIIGGILNIIPFIGFIIALLTVYPYLNMVYARALALLFASGEDSVTPEPTE